MLRGTSTKVALTVIVFGIGTGLGFAGKQGWLPIELLSPQTGVLEESVRQSETPGASSAVIAEVAPVLDADVVEQQSEPPVTVAELPPPRTIRRDRLRSASNTNPSETDGNAIRQTAAAVEAATVMPTPQPPGVELAQFDQPAPTQKMPSKISAPADEYAAALTSIDGHLEKEELLAAHKELSRLYWNHPSRRNESAERLNRTATAIFFSPRPHFIEPHVVEPGEQLRSIASQYKLTWEYLSMLNNIDPRRLQAGKKLKVIRGPFAAVVELDDFSLTVHLQGYVVKRYAVGIGKDGASPIGKFAVLNKVVNPQYTDPVGKVIRGDDPTNPLGERWIDLGNSYGIHGTIEPDSIGKAMSRGCIRLRDADVIEVYDLLVNGSEVVIRH